MGVFNNIKRANEKRRAKSIELKSSRGKFLSMIMSTQYMGGYGEHRKATGALTFYENQTEFKVSIMMNPKLSFIIPSNEISSIVIEGKDEVNRRVTVTRLLAVGIFAFALKKKTDDKEAFITLELTNGQEAIFHIKNASPMELKAKFSQIITLIKQSAPKSASTTAQTSVADELTKLAKLKEGGIITQAEFDKKKAELLA